MPAIKEEKTLAYQLISYIFTFLLMVFFASILVTRVVYSKIMLDNELEHMRHLVHERIHLIDGILARVEALAVTAQNLITKHEMSEEETEVFLRDLMVDNPHIHSICLADGVKSGENPSVFYTVRHRFTKRDIQGEDYRYRDWFQIPYITGKAYWIEPWVDTDGKGEMVISYSIPLYEAGSLRGVLRCDIELRYLQALIKDERYFKIGNSFLVSSTGTLVAHPDDTLVMNHSLFSLAQEYDEPALKSLGEGMMAGESGFIQTKGRSPFRDSWVYYQNLVSNKWSVGIAIEEGVLMREVRIILLLQTIAYILIFLLCSLVIYTIAMRLSRPLKELAAAADRIGAGDFNVEVPRDGGSHEIAVLSESFTTMQESLKSYIQNLRITTEEKNRIRGDVIYASEIQQKLIPVNTVHPYGIKELRAYGILSPAGDIGGDLYHYFMIDKDHFCFVIADVLGTGIVAAMAMTMVATFLPSIAPFFKRSSLMLGELNNFLCRNNIESNFVTAILGVIDIRTGVMEYSNCGHPPLYIRKADRNFQKYPETHSTALGVFEDMEIGCDKIQLDSGDEIILFTDGITEAMNRQEEFLGTGGLEQIISQLSFLNPERNAKEILKAVQDYARGSAYKDDITILVIDFKHQGVSPEKLS